MKGSPVRVRASALATSGLRRFSPRVLCRPREYARFPRGSGRFAAGARRGGPQMGGQLSVRVRWQPRGPMVAGVECVARTAGRGGR